MTSAPQPLLLYDGECGLCNATVRFMLRWDRRRVLRFAPLQGRTGQAFLHSRGLNTRDFDSIVFIADQTRADTPFFLRTTGALHAMAEMGGAWRRLARVALKVPRAWRDAGYKVIARTRYRLFGYYKPTPFAKPEWALRILD